MSRLGDDGLNLPFEEQEPTWVTDEYAVSGGVVVAGAVVPVPGAGNKPALLFRFAKVDGSGFWPPLLLVLEGDQVYQVPDLVSAASKAALKAVWTADGSPA